MLRGYLETVSELPWNRLSEETYDIRRAQLQLDKDHHGLDKVGSAMCASCVVCALALLVFFLCVCAFIVPAPSCRLFCSCFRLLTWSKKGVAFSV